MNINKDLVKTYLKVGFMFSIVIILATIWGRKEDKYLREHGVIGFGKVIATYLTRGNSGVRVEFEYKGKSYITGTNLPYNDCSHCLMNDSLPVLFDTTFYYQGEVLECEKQFRFYNKDPKPYLRFLENAEECRCCD